MIDVSSVVVLSLLTVCYLREIQGANWDAGIIVASNVDAQECACLCVNYTRPCAGVDYSVDDRSCFLHLRTAVPLGIQPASCCVRYDYSCNSASFSFYSHEHFSLYHRRHLLTNNARA